jgi:hypothetical protein
LRLALLQFSTAFSIVLVIDGLSADGGQRGTRRIMGRGRRCEFTSFG